MALDFRFRWIKTKLFQIGATRIDEISTDGTLAGNSDTVVPTEKAVKTYIDTKALEGNEVKDDPAPELAARLDTKGFPIINSTTGVVNTDNLVINNKLKIGVEEQQIDVSKVAGPVAFNDIPVGAWIIGYMLINETAIDTDNDDTYTGVINGTGSAIKINGDTPIPGIKNTQFASMTGVGIAEAPITVTVTPVGVDAAFTSGNIRVAIIYMAAEGYEDFA